MLARGREELVDVVSRRLDAAVALVGNFIPRQRQLEAGGELAELVVQPGDAAVGARRDTVRAHHIVLAPAGEDARRGDIRQEGLEQLAVVLQNQRAGHGEDARELIRVQNRQRPGGVAAL